MTWPKLKVVAVSALLVAAVLAVVGSCARLNSYTPPEPYEVTAAPSDDPPATAAPSRPGSRDRPSPRPLPSSPATPPSESTPTDRGPPREESLHRARDAAPPPTVIAPSASTGIGAHAAASRYDRVDDVLNQLEIGNVAFNAPQRLNLEETAVIHLALSLSKTIAELEELIIEDGEVVGHAVQVSDRMEARLTGPNFAITAITPEVQAVGRSGLTEWRWEVTPKLEGKHNLHLTLTAIIDVDGRQTQRSIRTLDYEIEIFVTWKQSLEAFLKKYWQWVWAAVLLPLIGWCWKKWKNKKATTR